MIQKSKTIMSEGGFNLREWSTKTDVFIGELNCDYIYI